MKLVKLINELNLEWMNIKKKSSDISMDLIHVIESNIAGLQIYVLLIEENYNQAIRLCAQNESQNEFDPELLPLIISKLMEVGVHCSSFYLCIRSFSDNLYRLHLEISESGKWGNFASMNRGLKNPTMINKLSDFDGYFDWFMKMRELRNCMKTGAYTSGGGYDPKENEITLSILVVEKDGRRAPTYERKLKITELEEALEKSKTCLIDICN